MIEVRRTELFDKWLAGLRDRNAKARILVRIDRLRLGSLGDAKSVASNLYELRVNYGPGYRIYFTWLGNDLILLLAGGDKKSQPRDIRLAHKMVGELEN
jgi:putative addiction module killer protein